MTTTQPAMTSGRRTSFAPGTGHRREAESPSLRSLVRMPYYVVTGSLAIIFLFPLAWAAVRSEERRVGK